MNFTRGTTLYGWSTEYENNEGKIGETFHDKLKKFRFYHVGNRELLNNVKQHNYRIKCAF